MCWKGQPCLHQLLAALVDVLGARMSLMFGHPTTDIPVSIPHGSLCLTQVRINRPLGQFQQMLCAQQPMQEVQPHFSNADTLLCACCQLCFSNHLHLLFAQHFKRVKTQEFQSMLLEDQTPHLSSVSCHIQVSVLTTATVHIK